MITSPGEIVACHRFLADLRDIYGVSVDFEAVLESHYRAFLPSDAIVIDVGAHSGRHTRPILETCPEGRVIAVEPLPDHARFLRETLGSRVEVIEAALGAREGRASFVWARGTPEESGLRARSFNDPERAQPVAIDVAVTTLDALGAGLARCDFVKIDVEGAEMSALQGGRTFLARTRPILCIEYGRPAYSVYGHNARDLFDHARATDYVVQDVFLNPIVDLATWLRVVDMATWDWFLIPREKAPLVPSHRTRAQANEELPAASAKIRGAIGAALVRLARLGRR